MFRNSRIEKFAHNIPHFFKDQKYTLLFEAEEENAFIKFKHSKEKSVELRISTVSFIFFYLFIFSLILFVFNLYLFIFFDGPSRILYYISFKRNCWSLIYSCYLFSLLYCLFVCFFYLFIFF